MATQDAFRNPWSTAGVGSAQRRFDTPRGYSRRFHFPSLRSEWIRRSLRIMLAALFMLAAMEFGLRTFEALNGAPLAMLDPIASLKHAPGSGSGNGAVNQLGYRDDEFRPRLVIDRYRVAVLGNELMLAPTTQVSCVDHLEQRLSNVDFYNFALPHAGPQAFVEQAAAEVLRFRPDVVLVFLTVGDEELEVNEPLFDWRSVRVTSRVVSGFYAGGAPISPSTDDGREPTYEQYLNAAARRLSACRVPPTAADQQRWHRLCSHLDDLVAHCRGGMTEVALVVMPADFQINTSLRQTLVRRAGGTAKDFDVDLPQRRLARYAQDHGVALLDLTPALRAKAQTVFAASAAHLNADGMAIAAQTLAEWIESRYGEEIRSMTSDALTQHP